MSQPNGVSQDDAPKPWAPSAHSYSTTVAETTIYAAGRIIELANQKLSLNDNRILDVGSGTGAVALTAASQYPSARILATDLTPSMVLQVSERQIANVDTKVVDALKLRESLPAQEFSHVFSTFVFQAIRGPVEVLKQIYTVLRPGGVIGIGLWGEHPDPLKIWTKACRLLDPSFELRMEDVFDDPKAWRTCQALENGFREAEFEEIETEEIYMPWRFESTDAYLDWWFTSENPCPLRVIPTWKGDEKLMKDAMAKVVREQYDNGQGIRTHAVLGIARMPVSN